MEFRLETLFIYIWLAKRLDHIGLNCLRKPMGTSGVPWDKKLELFLPQTSRATPGTSASIQYTSKHKSPNLFVSSHIYSFLRKVYVGFKMINIYYFLKSLSFRRKCLIFFCRISWLMMMFGDSTFHIVLVLSGLLTYSTYVNSQNKSTT